MWRYVESKVICFNLQETLLHMTIMFVVELMNSNEEVYFFSTPKEATGAALQ